MDVEVAIERDKDGRLHAYVIERYENVHGGELIRKGDDMLSKRVFRYIDNACSEAAGRLHSMFKSSIADKLNITFIYPDGR